MNEKEIKELLTASRNELIRKITETVVLKEHEIAEIVSLYYDCQDLRIAHANKKRTEPPSPLVQWLDFWLTAGEKVIHGKLANWVQSDEAPPEAQWAYAQIGIGPIIAAGLAAHIDVAKANYISSLWKFAGLAPGFDRRVKGVKLPYNAQLKVLCWKAGESFVKVSGKEGATYGKLYAQFKAQEIQRNESGAYKGAAKGELEKKKFKVEDSVTKKRLLAGMLSDAHLHARAKRRAVKMFLAHYWAKGREGKGLPVHNPYPIDIMGHSGKIEAA
jgi:hypothetical protein